MAGKVGKLFNKASDYDIALQECSQAVGDAGGNAFISGFLQLEDVALRKRRLEHLDASGIVDQCEDTKRLLHLFVKKAWDTKRPALHAKINALATDLAALYQLMDDDLRKHPCVQVMDADETRWFNQWFRFDHRARISVRGHHGFCLGYSRADASTFVHLVFVHPDQRRRGWATRVLQGLGDWAAHPRSKDMIPFYRRLGCSAYINDNPMLPRLLVVRGALSPTFEQQGFRLRPFDDGPCIWTLTLLDLLAARRADEDSQETEELET
jgi:GNAT superfamily N-acetyltransferase